MSSPKRADGASKNNLAGLGIDDRSVLDTLSGVSVIVIDLDRTIVYLNPGAELMHGCPADRMIGRKAGAVLGPAVVRTHFADIRRAVLDEKIYELDVPGLEGVTLRYLFHPFHLGRGEAVEAMVGIGRDVSTTVGVEQQIAERIQAEALKNELTAALVSPATEFTHKLDRVVGIIREQLGVRHCSIMLVRDDMAEVISASNRKLIGQAQSLDSASVSAQVIRLGRPLTSNQVPQNGGYGPKMSGNDLSRHPSRAFGCVPLINRYEVPLMGIRGPVVGVINVNQKRGGKAFDSGDIQNLTEMAEAVSGALVLNLLFERLKSSHAEMQEAYNTVNRLVGQLTERNVELEQTRAKLEQATADLEQLSITDDLTQIHNVRFFRDTVEREVQRARRYHDDLALLMIDIDHFKNYNDNNGHLAGDDALKKLAGILEQVTRATDVVARYGGEEFAIALMRTGRDVGLTIAERVRETIEQARFPFQKSQPLGTLTVSVGVAMLGPETGAYKALVSAADRALYRAKESGRNKVVLFDAGGEHEFVEAGA